MIKYKQRMTWEPHKLNVLADCIMFVSRRINKQPKDMNNREKNMIRDEVMSQLNIDPINKGGVRQKIDTIFSNQKDRDWANKQRSGGGMTNHIKIRHTIRHLCNGFEFPKIGVKPK